MATKNLTKKELQDEIARLQKEMERLERYSRYDEAIGELKAVYDGFLNAGFDENQAFELLKWVLNAGGLSSNNDDRVSYRSYRR